MKRKEPSGDCHTTVLLAGFIPDFLTPALSRVSRLLASGLELVPLDLAGGLFEHQSEPQVRPFPPVELVFRDTACWPEVSGGRGFRCEEAENSHRVTL